MAVICAVATICLGIFYTEPQTETFRNNTCPFNITWRENGTCVYGGVLNISDTMNMTEINGTFYATDNITFGNLTAVGIGNTTPKDMVNVTGNFTTISLTVGIETCDGFLEDALQMTSYEGDYWKLNMTTDITRAEFIASRLFTNTSVCSKFRWIDDYFGEFMTAYLCTKTHNILFMDDEKWKEVKHNFPEIEEAREEPKTNTTAPINATGFIANQFVTTNCSEYINFTYPEDYEFGLYHMSNALGCAFTEFHERSSNLTDEILDKYNIEVEYDSFEILKEGGA